MDTWVVRMVRLASRHRVVTWGAVVGCVVLFGVAQQRYIHNFILGPFELGATELDAITDVHGAPRYFARVTGSRAIDTGIQQITIRKRGGIESSRSVSGAYYALVIGDRFLVYRGAAGSQTTVEGALAPMRADLAAQLFRTPAVQAIRSRFYPFYLTDDSFRIPGYVGSAGAILLGFLLVKFGRPAWRYLQDPASHPVVKRVQAWGDPVGVANEAEREARSPRYKGGGWGITEKYLVRSTFFTFDLLRLSDLLWAYKKVTKHSVNFIPTGKTYEAIIICYGGTATVKSREKTVDEILAYMAQRAPWAVFGFTTELKAYFDKKMPEFCAAVEQRKREQAQQSQDQAHA